MKVTVLEPLGYCAGVMNAITKAIKVKKDNPNKDIFVFGKLVHNNYTIEKLKEDGITTLEVNKENQVEVLKSLKQGSVIIFTAHGHDEELDRIAKANGLEICDATCPVVKNNLELIKRKIKEGYKIFFIGKENHPETNAVLSISKDIILFDLKQLKQYYKTTNSPVFVANQTTLDYEELLGIHAEILKVFPNATIQNEVCSTTRLRQASIRNIPSDTDLILVVGSNISNNTTKLYEIAKSLYKEKDIRLIETINDLDINSIKNRRHVVVASGASTSPDIVKEIESQLINL